MSMDSNTVETLQSNVASQPSTSASSSRYNTYSIEACRLANSDPVSQPDDSSHQAPSSRDGDCREGKDSVNDEKSDGLEAMDQGGFKVMYAERDDRLLDGYFSRLGSKIQHAKDRKARKLAQRRRLLQDGKS
ncbi:hypothetical protein CH63R_12136 [Colletotrichum higginsianum IMI 349063]|uniref:Uncharacterized protein n=2 Tax=Colletotrichum higginsianum (strain IMI 349063) TaxID=759273 RepID=A0A1B7Y099_COLHI|nr:hypothetical protein CH63R_12136 [Colletotrichum higginsianum IMI 349063]OBR05433.1 hypothetical protein CH63R_12136 [Colletotrichum higginsianum IMI 349063]